MSSAVLFALDDAFKDAFDDAGLRCVDCSDNGTCNLQTVGLLHSSQQRRAEDITRAIADRVVDHLVAHGDILEEGEHPANPVA